MPSALVEQLEKALKRQKSPKTLEDEIDLLLTAKEPDVRVNMRDGGPVTAKRERINLLQSNS